MGLLVEGEVSRSELQRARPVIFSRRGSLRIVLPSDERSVKSMVTVLRINKRLLMCHVDFLQIISIGSTSPLLIPTYEIVSSNSSFRSSLSCARQRWPEEAFAAIAADFLDGEKGGEELVGDRRNEIVFIGEVRVGKS